LVNGTKPDNADAPRIGVLALQGDFAEHIHMLGLLGIDAPEIRKTSQLNDLDGLIIPGGESTTIVKLLHMFDFVEPLRKRVEEGMALWGTCAGMIVIARELTDPYPTPIDLIDIGVSRNYFGRQIDSFEEELDIKGMEGEPLRAVFIRAPIVNDLGDGVEKLAVTKDGQAVAVRSGNVLATSFHPELTSDTRLHDLFAKMARESGSTRSQQEESPSTV
jgi:5'-phosphate synthase pdxT subunit